MRLILWGVIIAIVAYAIMRLIFFMGRVHEQRKLERKGPTVIDTPDWKPPRGPYE